MLRTVVEGKRCAVVEADALRASTGPRCSGDERWTLVANLPYNVATPLVADLLDGVPQIERMLVMVQREVGERLAASPGDEAYGAVSVKVAYWAHADVVGKVPATVFLPKPKVESALVRIVRRETPAVGNDVDAKWLFRLVRAGFGQRRKMLRRLARRPGRRRRSSRRPGSRPRRGPRSSTSRPGAAWPARRTTWMSCSCRRA